MSGAAIRVLLVDDSREFLLAARALLGLRAGLQVVGTAHSGPEGIQAVDALRPDLVLMDYEMPEMTGGKAATAIKAAHPDVRVVIMSLHDPDWCREESRAAGADAFITKSQLMEAVDDVIASLFAERLEAGA